MGTNNFSPPAGFNQTISQAIAEAAACIAAVESTGVFQHVAIMEIADHETLTATVNEYNQQLHQFKSPRRSIIRRPSVWDDALNDTYFLNESPYSIHFNQGTTRDAARDAIIAQLVRDL
jgi:hypothetical protein